MVSERPICWRERPQLLLHRANVFVGGHRAVADAGDVLAREAAADADAEAGEADDERGHQEPDEDACASVAEAPEHPRPRPERWAASYALAGGVAREGRETGGIRGFVRCTDMHGSYARRMRAGAAAVSGGLTGFGMLAAEHPDSDG